MNLDIIAQLVQILRDAPELGAIEVRRGLFGSWSVVRLTKAGHQANAGGQHVVVAQAPVAETAASPSSAAAQRAPAAPGAGGAVAAPRDQVAHGGDVLLRSGAGRRALRQGGQSRGAAAGGVHHRGDEDHERNRVRGGGRDPGGAGGELPARRVRTGPFPSRPPCLKLPTAANRLSTSRRPSRSWSSATRRTCS